MGASQWLRIAAPAKVNLGLRVTGRRADGYHELRSLFVPLDLCDEVELAVEPAAAACVSFELVGDSGPVDAQVPRGAENLAARAAEGFLRAAGLPARVAIRLTKRIPAAAGLGGGSSDAGAVLRGLCELLPGALAGPALGELALRLGADVPYFLDPRPADVSGIGERIRPRSGVPSLALVLLKPVVGLSSAEVFRAYDDDALRGSAAAPPGGLDDALTRRDPPPTLPPPALAGSAALDLANDLEPVALRLCPPLARLREALRATGARAVGMTGSGPTLYGVYRDAADASAGFERLDARGAWARVVATVDS